DIETDGTADDKSELEIEVKGLDINISGLKQGEYVRLYDAVGKLVREQKADENGTAIVTASKTGVYLLQTDKLLKKVTIVAL
ncbi:MAG: T9SS type A sorting domain-containing protein, partial [Paludibacteraceae bacterium]|nr:T9SS type A sorting domain-containing protein [Paludibacteraceae bacterium]